MVYIRQHRSNGFTLIELVVVVVLIAMFAAAGGGMYVSSYEKQLVAKSAKEVYLMAKYARVLAVEQQTVCQMKINQAERAFVLVLGDDYQLAQAESEDKLYVRNLYSKPIQLTEKVVVESVLIENASGRDDEVMAEDDEQTNGEYKIAFTPFGTADTAAIVLGDGVRRYSVIISAATGKVRLAEGLPDESWTETIDLDL